VKRAVQWIGKTVLAILLLYFFGVLGSALWLREHLNSAEFARHPICWSRSKSHVDSPDKYRRRPTARDWLVIRTIDPGNGGAVPSISWRLRTIAFNHVYTAYWPETEREHLFEDVASGMRPCVFRFSI
jgi:hypothetical protein